MRRPAGARPRHEDAIFDRRAFPIQDAEDPLQPAPDVAQVLLERLVHHGRDVGVLDRLIVGHDSFLRELTTRAGQCEAVNEEQMFDAKDALDVATAINPRPARAFCDAQIWKLGFPRPEHVGLHVSDFADLLRPEDWPVRDGDAAQVFSGQV